MFSELQYWGIGITVLTFISDIYLTIQSPESPQVADEKQCSEQDSLTELSHLDKIPISLTQSQRAPRFSSVDHPLIISDRKKPESDIAMSMHGGSTKRSSTHASTAHEMTNTDEATTEKTSGNTSSNSIPGFDVGTSGETRELGKKKKLIDDGII